MTHSDAITPSRITACAGKDGLQKLSILIVGMIPSIFLTKSIADKSGYDILDLAWFVYDYS